MGEEKNKGLESIFIKQKNKSVKKKDSFEDEEEEKKEEDEGMDQEKKGKDINVEMQNFENL